MLPLPTHPLTLRWQISCFHFFLRLVELQAQSLWIKPIHLSVSLLIKPMLGFLSSAAALSAAFKWEFVPDGQYRFYWKIFGSLHIFTHSHLISMN
jgi:hypothetical protein